MKSKNELKDLLTSSSIPLALLLLLLTGFHLLIKLFGYSFVPFNELVLSIIICAIVIWLTIHGVRTRNKKVTNVAAVLSAALPLIALAYLTLMFISFEAYKTDAVIFAVYACITLIGSMVVFFSCTKGNVVKIVLGVLYIVILQFVLFILFITTIFSGVGANTVVNAEMSPNSVYLAEVISNDQGAMGGATIVTVSECNRDIHLVIGTLKKNSKKIYYGRWDESFSMTLRWETDEILYLNDERYYITPF